MRSSIYIDFDTGVVSTAPMDLKDRMKEPWTDDQKLDLFECRVEVWILGVAAAILRQIETNKPPSVWSHGAYGMLTICLTYFEMIGKILNPNSRTSHTAADDFNFGFCDVYPAFKPANGIYSDKIKAGPSKSPSNPDIQDVREFRDRTRNGLFHVGYTKHGVWIHSDPGTDDFEKRPETDPSGATKDVYRVNVYGVTRTLVDHFPTLIARVKTDPVLKKKFVVYFDMFLAP